VVDPSNRATKVLDLRSLACWDCWFEFRRGHGYPSLVNALCCRVEVSATGRSLVQSSPIECGVCVIAEPHKGGLGPLGLSNQGDKRIPSDKATNDTFTENFVNRQFHLLKEERICETMCIHGFVYGQIFYNVSCHPSVELPPSAKLLLFFWYERFHFGLHKVLYATRPRMIFYI
jgi:hypothetical protein